MKKRRSVSQEADSLPPSLRCSGLWAAPSVSAYFRRTGSDPHCAGRRPVRLGLEALLSGTAQLPDIRLRIPDRVICGRTKESLLSGALYRAAAMTEGLAQRMEQELGCPCTLVFTGGLGRFVAPLRRREVTYDEDLLLRGLWKPCTANCPSADKP